MMYAQPFREITDDKVAKLKMEHERMRLRLVDNFFEETIVKNIQTHPIPRAWDGKGA